MGKKFSLSKYEVSQGLDVRLPIPGRPHHLMFWTDEEDGGYMLSLMQNVDETKGMVFACSDPDHNETVTITDHGLVAVTYLTPHDLDSIESVGLSIDDKFRSMQWLYDALVAKIGEELHHIIYIGDENRKPEIIFSGTKDDAKSYSKKAFSYLNKNKVQYIVRADSKLRKDIEVDVYPEERSSAFNKVIPANTILRPNEMNF